MSENMDERLVNELRQDIRSLTEQVAKLTAGFDYLSKQVAESAALASRVAVIESRLAEQVAATERGANSTRWLIGLFLALVVAVVGWLSKGAVR